ncbi:MAG: phytanoyl-CoA dioxygenase family protein [Planctomycetota bacterium]|nr:phytanoyl-CoA dioxygenase family protein [Planctomycetota bacterium]
MPFLKSELKFTEDSLHPNTRGNILSKFRERGFAVVPAVFQRDSVDAFRAQIESLIEKGEHPSQPLKLESDDPILVHPARGPRLIDILKGTFMAWNNEPHPVLFHPAWVVRPANPDQRLVHDWHKDADHEGKTNILGYSRPTVVHVNMYFEDMTIERGPTYVVPRSHRDAKISPYDGAGEDPLVCNKGDAIIWDQRLWHRGSSRTEPGTRIVAIFGFFSVPITPEQWTVSTYQKNAYLAAETDQEKTLFGGPMNLEGDRS